MYANAPGSRLGEASETFRQRKSISSSNRSDKAEQIVQVIPVCRHSDAPQIPKEPYESVLDSV